MLDTETNREWLGLHEYLARIQHAEGFTGTVAQGKNHMIGLNNFAALKNDSTHATIFNQHIGDLLFEADLSTQRFDLLTHARHHAGESERTDMRLADVEDFFRRACLHE